jgi:ribosome recycling factor
VLATLTPERRAELVDQWRGRAEALDVYARAVRRAGDVCEADDANQAATDYRTAADELELGLELGALSPS